jgi:hypothetical protein
VYRITGSSLDLKSSGRGSNPLAPKTKKGKEGINGKKEKNLFSWKRS